MPAVMAALAVLIDRILHRLQLLDVEAEELRIQALRRSADAREKLAMLGLGRDPCYARNADRGVELTAFDRGLPLHEPVAELLEAVKLRRREDIFQNRVGIERHGFQSGVV